MGYVGGRVVCVCELINLRCVSVGMRIRAGGWGCVLGEGADFLVFRVWMWSREEKQENNGEKVHIPRKWGCVFYEISLKEAIIIIGK